MTDLYIEQATAAFQNLWTGGGQMTSSMPQVTDSIVALQNQLRVCDTALRSAVARMDAQDELINTMRDEITKLNHTSASCKKRLDLVEGNDGFVTRSQLASEFRALPEVESLRSLREQVGALNQRLAETTAEVLERTRIVEQRVPEQINRLMTDEAHAVKLQITHLENEQQSAVQRLTTSISKLTNSVHDVHAQCSRDVKDIADHTAVSVRAAREDSRAELDTAMTEVLTHLKRQAQVVDQLADDVRRKYDNIPSLEQLEMFRDDMRSTRGDMDRAQFRIHEAYSQVMALTQLAAESNTTRAASATGGSSSAQQAPQSHAVNNSKDVSSSWAATTQAAVVEAALEPVKRELIKLHSSTIPALSHAVDVQRDTLDGLLEVHRRAQRLLSGLFSCLGLRDRLDEMCSSIEAMDAAHVALMLRKALDFVQPARTGASSSAAAASRATEISHSISGVSPIQTSATPSQRLTGAAGHHTPLHYSKRSDSGDSKASRFQLGVDVADADGAAQVMAVLDGSVAGRVGIRRGDTITRVNGEIVEGATHFARLMRQSERAAAGSHPRVSLVVRSEGDPQPRVVEVPLA